MYTCFLAVNLVSNKNVQSSQIGEKQQRQQQTLLPTDLVLLQEERIRLFKMVIVTCICVSCVSQYFVAFLPLKAVSNTPFIPLVTSSLSIAANYFNRI